MAWGNITGTRIDGQQVAFETSYRIVDKDLNILSATGKERQYRPEYVRSGQRQTVKTSLEQVFVEQTVEDREKGIAGVSVYVRSDTARKSVAAYLCLDLPAAVYKEATITLGKEQLRLAPPSRQADAITSATPRPARQPAPRPAAGTTLSIKAAGNELQLTFSRRIIAFVKEEGGNTTVYIHLLGDNLKKGQSARLHYTLQAAAEIDHRPVEIAIDRHNPGRLFAGLGGNFRLQNPHTDPQVIDYCLNNLRLACGRVEMPWQYWHPDEHTDPLAEARAGRLDARVHEAMKMAQRLSAIGMPVIVSAWFPPEWAIEGGSSSYKNEGGVRAYRLDPSRKEAIYRSIAGYLTHLKQAYGVEAALYSFNESDLGIDILHTPYEHAGFIKELGACMASRGLSVKMLLGDNSDATTFNFILPALNDPDAHKYIGAISFHSWRGCDDETLKAWGEAARKLNVPLIIGEGSTDAAAWRYPQIFKESAFAFYEINLYTRICAVSQPLSILQWQLTSDYSLLWGAGIFGSEGPLRPTQRFWNLRQLSQTPGQSFALPFACNGENVNCAAFGNIARGRYAVHIVNNGASRRVTVKGLPPSVCSAKVYVTNSEAGMEAIKEVDSAPEGISFEMPPISFITLLTDEEPVSNHK
jgi:hypothetical protein